MTGEKVKRVFQFYYETLTIKACHLDARFEPKQFSDEEARIQSSSAIRTGVELAHLRFMCIEAQRLVDEGRTEKAMRWLGFLQGVLWARGFYSLDDLKNHSRPDGPI